MWFHVYFIIKIYLERIGYYPIREINVRDQLHQLKIFLFSMSSRELIKKIKKCLTEM